MKIEGLLGPLGFIELAVAIQQESIFHGKSIFSKVFLYNIKNIRTGHTKELSHIFYNIFPDKYILTIYCTSFTICITPYSICTVLYTFHILDGRGLTSS